MRKGVEEKKKTKTNPLCLGILDGGDETRDLIAHRLCSNAGGGSLEVDVTCATNTGIEGVATGHKRGGHGWTRWWW